MSWYWFYALVIALSLAGAFQAILLILYGVYLLLRLPFELWAIDRELKRNND
jgi:hypothetical protein